MSNYEIKELAKSMDVSLWQVAEQLGIHENTLCRMLRHDPDTETEQKILNAIETIAKGGEKV